VADPAPALSAVSPQDRGWERTRVRLALPPRVNFQSATSQLRIFGADQVATEIIDEFARLSKREAIKKAACSILDEVRSDDAVRIDLTSELAIEPIFPQINRSGLRWVSRAGRSAQCWLSCSGS